MIVGEKVMNEKKFQELVKKADLHEGSAVEVVYDEASINKLSTYVCRAVGFLASIEINILRTNVVLYPLKKTIPVVNVQTINDKPETPIKIDIPLTVIHHIEPLDVRKGFSIIDSMAGCLDFLSKEQYYNPKIHKLVKRLTKDISHLELTIRKD